MSLTLAQPAVIPATTTPSPDTMAWAAENLLLIGFTAEDARLMGLPVGRASELEAAMARSLLGAVLEVSRP